MENLQNEKCEEARFGKGKGPRQTRNATRGEREARRIKSITFKVFKFLKTNQGLRLYERFSVTLLLVRF